MSTIHYSEMLKLLEEYDHERSSKTFSIDFVDFDERRKSGGREIRINKAQKCGLPYHCADHEMRGLIDRESGKKRAFHLRLVQKFNDLTVYW